MDLSNKTVGIWGLGVVGSSAAQFIAGLGARIIVYDDNSAAHIDGDYLRAPTLQALFDATDALLPSPGIDTRPYRSVYAGKWLCELDLFAHFFKKPVIAITGSVGKTTVTHVLTQLLKNKGIAAIAAGNIGKPMLSIIADQHTIDIIVLELSSFQLEYSAVFSPTIAIITNVHPNHLDRHGTMNSYFDAKYNLIAHQNQSQYAIVPYELKEQIMQQSPKSMVSFFSPSCITNDPVTTIFCHDALHKKFHKHGSNVQISTELFPPATYLINWLTIWSACTLLNINLTVIPALDSLEHRLEIVGKIKGVTFINDSKSTTPTSTLSAIAQFSGKKILLLLGGLSKGIDKTTMIQYIAEKNIETICFGKEAEQIAHLCAMHNIKTRSYQTLQEAFAATLTNLDYDYVLFSPSGTSYDLFKDYIERGNIFKTLVKAHF